MNVEIRKIINPSSDVLKITTDWMYNWWGIEEGYSYNDVYCYMKNSFNNKKFPQTYGMFLENELIGMYQFTYRDLFVRPDIYPWVANVYIDEKYRNKGLSMVLIDSIKKNARKNCNSNEMFLYTKHKNLYEKYGWKFIGYVDDSKEEYLYKMVLKNGT